MSEIEPLTLTDGRTVDSHTMSIHDEAMRESLDAAMVEGATHVVTIRGGRNVHVGDKLGLRGGEYEALAVYDPYDRPGVEFPPVSEFAEIRDQNARQVAREAAERQRNALMQSVKAQKGKWTKILIRM